MAGIVPFGDKKFKNWYDVMIIGKEVLNTRASADDAVIAACQFNGVKRTQLFAEDRHTVMVEARAMLIHYLYTEVGMTYVAIGKMVGGRDHSTMLNANTKHKNWMEVDKRYATRYAEYVQLVNSRCIC